MASAQYGRLAIALLAALQFGVLLHTPAFAGDAFTGYQVDNKGQYFAYLGIRAPLMDERKGFQPFIQVLGAGVGYTFKDNGRERDANLQSVGTEIHFGIVELSRNGRPTISLEAGRSTDRSKK